MKKAVPKFSIEDAERKFWASHGLGRLHRLAQGQTRHSAESETFVADHLDPPAEANARALEDPGQQA